MKLPQPAGADWSGGASPLPRLLAALVDARRNGLGFSEAWADALLLVPSRADRELVAETAEAWRAAYVGDPPLATERVLAGLPALVEDEPAVAT